MSPLENFESQEPPLLEIAIPQFGRISMLFRLIDDLDLALSQLDNPSLVQVRIVNDEKGTADLIRQKIASVASSNSFSLVQNSERLGLSKNLVEAASGGPQSSSGCLVTTTGSNLPMYWPR